MLAKYKTALICDFAEFYHILDYRKVPVDTLGILAAGLGTDSRVGMEMSGVMARTEVILLAELLDTINAIIYGVIGKGNEPEPLTYKLIKNRSNKSQGLTIEEFEEQYKKIFREE